MGVQDTLVKTSLSEVENAKDTIARDDNGELGAVPILKYHGDIIPSGDEQAVIYTTMTQDGWTALWSLLATSGTLSISYQNLVSTNIVLNPGFVAHVGSLGLGAGGARAFDPKHIDAWSGAHTGGFLFAALLSWIPSDYLGRKKTLLMAMMLSMIAFLVQMLARHWSTWLVSRVFSGMASGLNQCAAIAYLSEASPSPVRGASLGGYQVALCLGQLLASCAEQLLIHTSPSSYRRLFLSQLALSVPAVLAIAFLPESPRWYAATGQPDQAHKSLSILRRGWDDSNVDSEYGSLMAELDDEQDHTFQSLFRGSSLRRLLVSTFPLVWQCWSGLPVITRYFRYFFQLAGVIDPFSSELSLYLLLVAGAIVSIYLVEKVGRRPLLLWLGPVMVVCLFAVGGLVRHAPRAWSGAVLTSFGVIWVAAYGASVGPLAFVYLGEVSNDRLKARTISIATTLAGILNSVAVFCTPLIISNPTFRLFAAVCLFGCVGLTGWILCYLYIPETRGLSYPQLEDLFRGRGVGRAFNRSGQTPGNDQAASNALDGNKM